MIPDHLLDPPEVCTTQRLAELIRQALPGVREVEWRLIAPGMGVATLRFRWWAWLLLGAYHARAHDIARAVIDRYAPARSSLLVRVW